jgi:hypothetical protein
LLRRLNPLLLPTLAATPRQHRLQERPGITALLPHDLLRRPRGHDLAAAVAAFGAEVDDPVGGFDDFEIVLDDHHGVAGVDQLVQHLQELSTSLNEKRRDVTARQPTIERVRA